MSTVYHCHVDLDALCKGRRDALGWLRAYDKSTATQCDAVLIGRAAVMRAKGMEGWPLCDCFDERGMCKGHARNA